jgi:transposase
VAECEAPGSSVSLVARKYGISSSLLFRWRQLKESGGVSGLWAESVVRTKRRGTRARTPA